LGDGGGMQPIESSVPAGRCQNSLFGTWFTVTPEQESHAVTRRTHDPEIIHNFVLGSKRCMCIETGLCVRSKLWKLVDFSANL